MITFAVVTKVPDVRAGDSGNLACAFELYTEDQPATPENNYCATVKHIGVAAFSMLTPVFHVGEIVILNESGREVCYPGRKPDKWDVEVEEFDDLGTAIARAAEVFDASLP